MSRLRAWWRRFICDRLDRHDGTESRYGGPAYCPHCYRMVEHNVGAGRWFAVSGPQR